MSEQKYIRVDELGIGPCNPSVFNDPERAHGWNELLNIVRSAPTYTPADILAGMWVPVTERLPEDGKFVLVCNDDGHMMIAKHETETCEWYYKYTNYDFDIWDNEEQGPVCYWMPLPEPPKEES